MIDASQLLATLAPTADAAVAAPDAATGDGFAAVFDQVASEIAATLLPFMKAPQPEVLPGGDALTLSLGDEKADIATDTAPEGDAAPVDEPKNEFAVLPSVLDAVTESVAVARVALGLPTPTQPAPVAAAAPQPAATTVTEFPAVEPLRSGPIPGNHNGSVAPKRATVEPHEPRGVAVGHTGVMPASLPEQAHAAEVLPRGIAAKAPVADAPAGPAPTEPAANDAAPADPVHVDVAPVLATTPDTPVAEVAPEPDPVSPAESRVVEPEDVEITRVSARETVPPTAVADPPAMPDTPAPDAPPPAPTDMPGLDAMAAAVPAMPHLSTAETAAPVERPHVNGVGQPLRAALRTLPKDAPHDRPNTISLTVRLDPPELGAVRLRVVAHGERVHVTMHAESPEAVVALAERRQDVVELLRQDGFSLEGYDVDTRERREQETPQQSRRRDEPEWQPPMPEQDDNELRL